MVSDLLNGHEAKPSIVSAKLTFVPPRRQEAREMDGIAC